MLREFDDIVDEGRSQRWHPQFPQKRALRRFRIRLTASLRFGRIKIQMSTD
jgi:hypothetical protein